MKKISKFSLKKQTSPYEAWQLKSELWVNGERTGKYVPGFVIEAQYSFKEFYLLVTSWDCVYEESQEFLLLSHDLDVLSKKHVGEIYSSVRIEYHEAVAVNQVLFHCNRDLDVLITADTGLLPSFPPVLKMQKINRTVTAAAK